MEDRIDRNFAIWVGKRLRVTKIELLVAEMSTLMWWGRWHGGYLWGWWIICKGKRLTYANSRSHEDASLSWRTYIWASRRSIKRLLLYGLVMNDTSVSHIIGREWMLQWSLISTWQFLKPQLACRLVFLLRFSTYQDLGIRLGSAMNSVFHVLDNTPALRHACKPLRVLYVSYILIRGREMACLSSTSVGDCIWKISDSNLKHFISILPYMRLSNHYIIFLSVISRTLYVLRSPVLASLYISSHLCI